MEISHVTLTSKALSLDQERISYSYEPVEGGILAKITLYSFYENKNGINSERDIKNAFQELEKKGKILGVILDLRNNAGGFLHQAVKVSGLFISNGIVVISKYGSAEKHYLRAVGNTPCFTGPCIVLTSKLSASAAEIVAQALQDYGVALVVGDERTFGKGTIQYQTVTQNKADAYFKVTVGRYYTVSGKSTQIDGVIADIVVPSEYTSYNFGERFLEYPLPADHIQSAFRDPLEDLEEPARTWFQKFYLPKQQKKVTLYQKMLPVLRQNSLYRQTHDPKFKQYLEQQKNLSWEMKKKPLQEDAQMDESVNILKDMIILESQQKAS
jgi:carboxyl-terminal processing protease